MVYRLPDNWNGKVYGIGGGGWAGNVTLQAATDGLTKGYATMQTDGRPSRDRRVGQRLGAKPGSGQGLQLPRDPRDDGDRQELAAAVLRPQVRQRLLRRLLDRRRMG